MEHAQHGEAFDRIIDRRDTDSIKWSHYDRDVLPMWVADMDFTSPEPVLAALRERIDHGVFGYPVPASALRRAVVERLHRLYQWDVTEESVVFSPNVVVGFNLAARAFTSPGDGLLIQTPIYFPILRVPGNANLQAQHLELTRCQDGYYEIDFDRLERTMTRKTSLFILCNPHNPVGRAFTRQELERMAEACVRHNTIICADEIHADFVYDGKAHLPIASIGPEIEQRTITLIAPTKTYNLAGLSCAIAVIPNRELREGFVEAKRGLVSSPGALAYTAALAAFQHGSDWLAGLLSYLQTNRDVLTTYVAEHLPELHISPIEATYLAWLDCRRAGIPGNPQEFFLRNGRVAFNDGAAFGPGGDGFVRLNFGCPRSVLLDGLDRMRRALDSRSSGAG